MPYFLQGRFFISKTRNRYYENMIDRLVERTLSPWEAVKALLNEGD